MSEEEILKECTELAENEHHELGDCWDEEYSSSAIFGLIMLYKQTKKELNNLKEIEKSHKEENGKLRVELEQEKEKNMHLNEKNIMYKNSIPNQSNFYDFSNYISKNQIKEKIEELEKEQEEYENSQEWEIQDDIVAQINILKDLLEV